MGRDGYRMECLYGGIVHQGIYGEKYAFQSWQIKLECFYGGGAHRGRTCMVWMQES